MKIRVAESAGFCFGVRRAMELAVKSAPAVTLGPLIHNRDAVEELKGKGVYPAESDAELPEGARVIIRSHGVSKELFERLQASREVVDATCPFVKAIHNTVRKASENGIPVVVAGQREHPEVIGIIGWCAGPAIVVGDESEAAALPPMEEALVVSQTTMGREMFGRICEVLKTRIARPDIRDTVCDATRKRQAEAEELAKQSTVMLVVGDKMSANTRRLTEIASAHCKRTYLIDRAEELDHYPFAPYDIIGITAGASTPCRKYEEVVAHMNDIETKVMETITGEDFASEFEKTMVQIRPGQSITGTVLLITEEEVSVNIGYKSDGLIKKSDLCDTDVKVGDEIEVEVVKVNDGEGNVLLSQKNIINRKVWAEIQAKYENGEYVTATAKEAVKGGLLCEVEGIRTFVPASQLSSRYVDKIDQFVGQEMQLKIIELDATKKRIVASRKAVIEAEAAAKKAEVWGKLEKDAIVTGIVRRLTDFGAFVDLGGVDGLVHVTNLSWGRVAHPSEVVKVGDEIEVKILDLNPEKERISLSRKATLPRPWENAAEKYEIGSVVEGKVVRITSFGAFVELQDGLDGLVHISQCALTRIEKVEDALKVGQTVRVKVLDVDTEKKRISLSVRAVLEDEAMADSETDVADEFAIDENN